MSERSDEAEVGERLAIQADSHEAERLARVDVGQGVAELLRAPVKSARTKAPRAKSTRDERPTFKFSARDPHVSVDAAIVALRNDEDLYQRDQTLVHVVKLSQEERKRIGQKRAIAIGTPRIVPMSTPILHLRVAAQVKWERYDERNEKYVMTGPPEQVVKAIATHKVWPGIRRLMGILEAPSLRPDGTIIDESGYDEETGFDYDPNSDFPVIPEHPTPEDGRAALALLEDVFIDFPYNSPADRAVAVAALLTIVARPAINGATPAFLFDANAPGSGKSLQASTIVAIATGRPGGNQSYPEDPNELDKVLGAVAIDGSPILNFDNVVGRFGRGTLDRCISSVDSVSLRVLGKSENRTIPWRTVVLASGNNIEVGADGYRRVLVSRINTQYEDAELRPATSYVHPERCGKLLAYVIEERPRLVCAALMLLRAFIVAGRPPHSRTMAGFEQWAELVPAAIVWAGGADPLQCRPVGEANQDPKRDALRTILESWHRLDTLNQGLTVRALVDLLYTKDRLRGEAPPDGLEDMREAIQELVSTRPGHPPDAKKLGDQFRMARGRNIGGKKIEIMAGAHRRVARWTVLTISPNG